MYKSQTIKKSALVLGAAVLIAGAATLSVRHYNEYQAKQNQARQVVVDKQAKELADAKAARTELVGKYNLSRIECEKGVASYDLLTVANKAKTPRPICGAVIL